MQGMSRPNHISTRWATSQFCSGSSLDAKFGTLTCLQEVQALARPGPTSVLESSSLGALRFAGRKSRGHYECKNPV